MEDAVEFIRSSHVLPLASAHLLYTDSLTGFSTRPNQATGTYDVSYEGIDLLRDISWISDVGEEINVTRA